jgi:uracil-DNA glycosylase
MQTISIETIANVNGDRVYRAAIGDRQSIGKTAGEALDALTVQMGNQEINGFLLLPSYQPDQFFTAQQQQRLTELMSIWRTARDRGETITPEQQSELDDLIEAELDATAERAKAILSQTQP